MSKPKLVLTLMYELLMHLAMPIIAPFLLLFARKTDVKTTHYGQDDIQRYRLPGWLFYFETPDEHLPGGMYEPTVKWIYDHLGRFICAWYWIGFRNVVHGAGWNEGKEIPKKIKDMSDAELKQYGVYSNETIIWKFKLIEGWKGVNDNYSLKTDKGIWAVRRVTVRWVKQE